MGIMASDRAKAALSLRRGGAKYSQIANTLAVSPARARQLVLAAYDSEANAGPAGPVAFDSAELEVGDRGTILPKYGKRIRND